MAEQKQESVASDKVIILAGYGKGVGHNVAVKLAKETKLKVALLSRTKDKLDKAVEELKKIGVDSRGFPTDLGNVDQIKASFALIKKEYGSAAILVYNAAYFAFEKILEIGADKIDTYSNIMVKGFITSVQQSFDDLKANEGTIFVTGGGFAIAPQYVMAGAEVLAAMKAAQHNLVETMAKSFKEEKVKIYEVMIMGMVNNDDESDKYHPSKIAQVYADTYKDGLKDDKVCVNY